MSQGAIREYERSGGRGASCCWHKSWRRTRAGGGRGIGREDEELEEVKLLLAQDVDEVDDVGVVYKSRVGGFVQRNDDY